MTECTFVHAADLHLDAPIEGLGRELPVPESGAAAQRLARLLRDAAFIALERLVDLCVRQRADALLLAGDVYTSEQGSLRARLALREACERLGREGIAVFMVHGNHDPLRREGAAIAWPENVTLFGRTASARPLISRSSGLEAALVQGVSHSGPREERNLAAAFSRAPSPLFQIGLLHGALSGMTGSHKLYAPCTPADLAASGLDYWALGHVHGAGLLDRDGKAIAAPEPGETALDALAAYPGSAQGLHVNESGPHGCLLGRIGGGGGLRLAFVPLAPVQWEQVVIDADSGLEHCEELPALLRLILDKLEPLAPQSPPEGPGEGPFPRYAPEAVLARLTLAGRSPLDRELRAPGAEDDLRAHLNAELAGSGVFVRDLILATRPPLDLESLLAGKDLAADTLRLALALKQDPDALDAAARRALAPLFDKSALRKALGEEFRPDAAELAALTEEAAFLCLELLGAEDREEDF